MCKHHGEASLNPWANIIENHQEETLAHWESHFTNTCIEELSGVTVSLAQPNAKPEAITPLKKLITMLHFAVGNNSTSPPQLCTTENVEEPIIEL